MKRALLMLLLLCGMAYAQKPVFTTAKVKAATVYFNAAEITQSATVNLPAGTSEIVVKNVADYLNEGSVQIGAPATLTVLSVQFTTNYISEFEPDETSPALKRVRDSIAIVKKELEKTTTLKASEFKILELLDKNNQVYGQQSGLSVAELVKMVDYYKAKRNETSNTINALTDKEQKLNELFTKLSSRLETNTREAEKTSAGKLVLQVMNEQAGNVALDISYLTGNASWTPFYDLRADNTTDPINMLYKAQVVQQTGIDWKKVKLTLSSGVPNQNNQAPEINPWFLQYGSAIYGNRAPGIQIRGVASSDKEQLNEVVVEGYRSKASSVSANTTITENQLSVSFDIDIPYDIASNGKKHSVTLKEIKLPATYRHYAVPKAEKEAFLMAEINDYSKYNLLKGEANIIFDGMYAGKTFIDPNQTTDTLRLGMGRDRKISIEREKVVEKSGTKFLSSRREQTFTYDVTIRNNKKEAAQIVVKENYPISTDKEMEIELLESSSADVNKETALLQWDIKLKPGETKKLRISYKVKYPKDRSIINL
ncbi:DUF4139 domain-containing protein [Flavobacterium subsaxonicum]|uniref:Membrane protein n=1 Tax=Flavobacterium subsaxonicum WB 4.1-42 = DSM 21790 TaxID=1121898 RepID=A0A0A2MSH3_9FLAO|nr:DUF4139 domain-containing protein [Flavobacterium subsaxonicum]KGO91155.1 membrane protein [Flavobacterium subsaxonicum WB 4.1-42 = DSM 21790]